jgi:hypothetical protein
MSPFPAVDLPPNPEELEDSSDENQDCKLQVSPDQKPYQKEAHRREQCHRYPKIDQVEKHRPFTFGHF